VSAADAETCTWCDAQVEPTDGFRAHEPAGARYAVFCRLEHIVPWEIQGGVWLPGPAEDPGISPGSETGKMLGRAAEEGEGEGDQRCCSHCDAALDETAVFLVRHRGEHRIVDGFCSAAHMAAWAKAGGRWQ
jgi:hypothetical protein